MQKSDSMREYKRPWPSALSRALTRALNPGRKGLRTADPALKKVGGGGGGGHIPLSILSS